MVKDLIIYSVFLVFVGFSLGVVCLPDKNEKAEVITEYIEKPVHVDTCYHNLTDETLRAEISKYNFRFPHIIYAQVIQETNLKSDNLVKYNNLFGLKPAKKRLTNCQVNSSTVHGVYDDWRESLVDRALFEATFLYSIKTEDEYYSKLKSYATDKEYINKLKIISKRWKKN